MAPPKVDEVKIAAKVLAYLELHARHPNDPKYKLKVRPLATWCDTNHNHFYTPEHDDLVKAMKAFRDTADAERQARDAARRRRQHAPPLPDPVVAAAASVTSAATTVVALPVEAAGPGGPRRPTLEELRKEADPQHRADGLPDALLDRQLHDLLLDAAGAMGPFVGRYRRVGDDPDQAPALVTALEQIVGRLGAIMRNAQPLATVKLRRLVAVYEGEAGGPVSDTLQEVAL